MRVGSGLQAAAGGAARAKENREHSTISRSNTHEVLPQGTARSVDVSFRCPPVTSRRRQRTHARASTPKGERACRAANASQEKPTRGRQQHTPPTTTAWQKLRAAPTPPRGRHLPFEGHDHSPTPLQQTRVRSLLHRTNKPPRAVWQAAVHHIPSTPWAQRAASSLPCPPPH